MKYNRNFPMDFLSAAQALIAAGLPRQIAFKALSFVDDVGEVIRLIETEKDGIPDLDEGIDGDPQEEAEGKGNLPGKDGSDG